MNTADFSWVSGTIKDVTDRCGDFAILDMGDHFAVVNVIRRKVLATSPTLRHARAYLRTQLACRDYGISPNTLHWH